MDGLVSPREPKIYECLLIIEFDEDEPGALRPHPCAPYAHAAPVTRAEPSQRAQIKYTYPESISDATIVKSAPVFCFPEERITLSWEQKRHAEVTEEFSFVLTAVDGSKRFGFCRRYMLKPAPGWKPLCYCLISTWSTFALFRVILDVVEVVQPQGIIALDNLLEGVQAMRMPAKGCALHLNVLVPIEENTESQVLDPVVVAQRRRAKTDTKGGAKGFLDYGEEQRTFEIVRPDADYEFLDYVTFEPLFSRFSVKDILIIFTALLRERRILVVSSALSNLTGIINALVALVSPFSWQVRCVGVLCLVPYALACLYPNPAQEPA